jgi:hypothetical protein
MVIRTHLQNHNDMARIKEYTWLGVDDMQHYLGKSSGALKQTRGDFYHLSERSTKLRAKMRLVVPMRLQAQQPPSGYVPRVIHHSFR